MPILAVAIFVIGPGIAWKLHRRGGFHTIKTSIKSGLEAHDTSGNDHRPGGMEPIVLERALSGNPDTPQFLSATLLPGVGMSVLQITANLPGLGETHLLSAPTVQAIAEGTTGTPNGPNQDFGTIEVPWGGQMTGASTPAGTSVIADWQGQQIEESTDGAAQSYIAEGGNLRTYAVDDKSTTRTPDGMKAEAVFHGLNSDGRWPSKTDVSVVAQLNAKSIELTVLAKNTGDRAEPLGIGWHPRFSVIGADRDRVQLLLPTGDVMEMDATRDLPTGILKRAALKQFSSQSSELGPDGFDTTLVNLKATSPDGSPSAQVLFPHAGFGLRMTALSSAIRVLRVTAPAASDYVSFGMQTNLGDPFGKQWKNTGIASVNPGETLEWKVRLEIFPIAKQ